MTKTITSLGCNLYRPFENLDQWVFDFNNGDAIHGNFKEITTYMVRQLDFNISEIESAIESLIVNDTHTSAHFGCYKTFIYSYEKFYTLERIG